MQHIPTYLIGRPTPLLASQHAIEQITGQSYKASTIVIYDLKIPPYYDSRLVNYEHKLFIRLTTEVNCKLLKVRICTVIYDA